MTKEQLLQGYEQYSKADKYIVGFAHKGFVYAIAVDNLDPKWITLDSASKGQGQSLRFYPKSSHKEEMRMSATCIGTIDLLADRKYNKGDVFEKTIVESLGITWTKNHIPFYEKGDFTLNGIEYQVKFEKASLITSNLLERLAR